MSNFNLINFKNDSKTGRVGIDGIFRNTTSVNTVDKDDVNESEEDKLRNSYLRHSKRLLTETLDENGNPEIKTLKGVVFPAEEIAKVLNNSSNEIKSVFFEFCHHGLLSGKDEFSIMITGLDVNDKRIKEENGESRVYEFAQSCPNRCPKEESFPLT